MEAGTGRACPAAYALLAPGLKTLRSLLEEEHIPQWELMQGQGSFHGHMMVLSWFRSSYLTRWRL